MCEFVSSVASEIQAVKYESSQNIPFYKVKTKSHNFDQWYFKFSCDTNSNSNSYKRSYYRVLVRISELWVQIQGFQVLFSFYKLIHQIYL